MRLLATSRSQLPHDDVVSRDVSPRRCNLCGEQQDIRLLYCRSNCSILECQTCSLVYTNEIPSNDKLAKIYATRYFDVGNKYTGHSRSAGLINAEQRVEQILILPGLGLAKWLDIGCATGWCFFGLSGRRERSESQGDLES